jgi:hypothetical protein
MKKIIISSFLALLSGSCTDTENRPIRHLNYPEIISRHHIEEIYDLAKYELYKMNSCCECNCVAKQYPVSNGTSYLFATPLSLDVDLDTILLVKDTIWFYFSYSKTINNSKIKYKIIDDIYKGCTNNYSISFDVNTKKPLKCYSDENLIGEFGKEPKLNNLEDNLLKCIARGDTVNKWLIEFMSRRNK